MFCGFYGLNRSYVDPDRNASTFLLAFYMWLTGLASCAGTHPSGIFLRIGFNAALNAAAKNFPATRGNLRRVIGRLTSQGQQLHFQ